MDSAKEQNREQSPEEVVDLRPILEAKTVYILMSKDHRISRNRRAEWFFSRFNSVFSLPKDDEIAVDEVADFRVVSVIPKETPVDWSPKTRHSFRYKITTKTIVTYLSRRYRIVYCIDVSPSVAAVDVQAGTVIFDGVFQALKASLDGLMRPFYIHGSTTVFQPKIFITVITHSPFVTCINNEVILQGTLLGPSTYNEILETVFEKLNITENKMAKMTSTLLKNLPRRRKKKTAKAQSSDNSNNQCEKSTISTSSDFSLVDLLKQALIALSLLPENSSSGLVILTDGVVSVPDGRYLDIILSQLRYNTVSCSFIQLSSPFHPHLCHGALPYVDLMKFISSATFGAFLTEAPEMTSEGISEMNVYHLAFLAWSFQSADNIQADSQLPLPVKPGEWSIRNKCFFTIRDMPIVKKQQFESTLAVDYMKVLSCRLREGFMIKDITLNEDALYVITLTLPWKFLIHLEYVVITARTPGSETRCILSLEGPYDFLHDVTCLASRSFPSIYRQLMVNRFWATRKNLSESDRLLVHLNSFSSNSAFYSIPDSLRNGVPLFYFSTSSSVPQLQSSDFPYPNFAQFWKPVCMLDTNVWQKWMHTHRIGTILEHDHPLPKHLHCPNSAGRFQVILCRQAIMALNTLLKNSSSFVLVENHSYVTMMFSGEDEKGPPFSFYIIRVTSKPPYVVLRLAFLVGTPGNLRHKTVSSLREKIGALTFPQRLKEPPRWRFPSGGGSHIVNKPNPDQANKASWSDMPCCLLMNKPIEKILIRYEKIPQNFCVVLMPQHSYESTNDSLTSKSSKSTFGFKPTHPSPGTTPTPTIMVPEMFNTVARYLQHKRWIWFFPKCLLPDFNVKDASEILTIITKMRLQEGFRFAYSSAGTVSMVLEVQMQNKTSIPAYELGTCSELAMTEEETYLTPCVIQFVMFPPTSSLTGPNFEDDLEFSEESKDLFLITECWIEPQCGKISGCKFTALNGLEFNEISDQIFEINKECLLTLGAFDFLRGTPANNSMDSNVRGTPTIQRVLPGTSTLEENNIVLFPFEFELGRVLPKCSQAEILFSMFFQDLRHAFSVEARNEFVPYHERANEILYNNWTMHLATVHDNEINIEPRHFESLLTMVLSREDVTKTGKDPKFNADDLPAWKCFVKSVDSSQQLITLLPKTLRDAKLLFLIIEKCKCVLTAAESKCEETNMPCLLSTSYDADNKSPTSKLRQRKVSAPNCCQNAPGTAGLVTHLPVDAHPVIGRKRIRALSGGESAPVLKKAFTVDSSFNDTLVQSFFEEPASKYIVPQTTKTIVDDLNLSFGRSFESNETVDSETKFPDESSQFQSSDDESSSMVGSLSMPLFMYDCSLSTLRCHLILKGSQEVPDRCLDFRIFSIFDGSKQPDGVGLGTTSTDSNTLEAKKISDDLDMTSTELQNYCKTLQLAYKNTFIRSIFQSLQLGFYVSTKDLKAVINLCHKDLISIDITEFLKNVCSHDQDNFSCRSSKKIRAFVRRKFRDILTKKFNYTKVDSDLFYFRALRLYQSQETVFKEYDHSTPVSDFDVPRRRDSEPYRGANNMNGTSEHFTFSDISHNARNDSESYSSEPTLPLFMFLRCSSQFGAVTKKIAISDLPVCIDDFDSSLRAEMDNGEEHTSEFSTKLELVILTCPLEYNEDSTLKRIQSVLECKNISNPQIDVLKTMINEIEWLLNDEITSSRVNTTLLSPMMLQEIATHVSKSTGKQGCSQQCIPLQFVKDSPKGYHKFVDRVDNLFVPGFGFKKQENWWYLIESDDFPEAVSQREEDVFLSEVDPENQELINSKLFDLDDNESKSNSVSLREFNMETRLPFWVILRVEQQNVFVYCHCRYDENDLDPLTRCMNAKDMLLRVIVHLVRIVNQDLLLQSLHDTRLCSPLLEPDSSRAYIEESNLLDSKTSDENLRSEGDMESISNQIPPGTFACDVVWETTFKLHPRLRSGPGKSAFSRGMQILRSTLVAFEVSNRENMFVYRNALGNVFYVRLYRVYEAFEDIIVECPSENPSPRSSISIKTRAHHPSADSNKDDSPLASLKDTQNGRAMSDGVVLLKVHGVTEAGNEIKEQLIQSLRNKLDDAVLDVLSVTLDRNPHCKLTPEDVHFIQKPQSTPDAVVRFTTGKFVKLLLPPFAFYLHQNLLQFLNIPKYTRSEQEFHFRDYHRSVEDRLLEEHNVYLYNQSPGGTGSRGVACVSVSLIDKCGRLLRCLEWKHPWNFQFSLSASELSTFIETEEINVQDDNMSDIVVELCVWKQGRINLDILKTNFLLAIKHGGWDLGMEYQILTPSLFSPKALEDQEILDRNKDLIMGYKLARCSSPNSASLYSGRPLRRRNSSAAPLGKIDDEQNEDSRERSWSYTMRGKLPTTKEAKLELPLQPVMSKSSLRGSTASTETIRSTFDFIGTRRNIIDDASKLHSNYMIKLKKWCNVGEHLNLPSLRIKTIKFKPQHSLDETVQEIIKIIHSVAPDNSTAQFWKCETNMRDYLGVGKKIRPDFEKLLHKANRDVNSFKLNQGKLKSLEKRDEEAEYPEELLQLFTTPEYFQPSSKPSTCMLIGRNFTHWEACVSNKKCLDIAFHSSDVIKSLYKFFPLMSEPTNLFDDKISLNADKLKFPTKNGLLALLGDISEESCIQSILVPRQRFLLATLSKNSAEFVFYNWSKETSDKLIDHMNIVANWSQQQWKLLSSVLLQKSGIFYNQPFFKEQNEENGKLDIKELVRHFYPPKPLVPERSNKNNAESRSQISDLYRNLHHTHLLLLHVNVNGIDSPITTHGEQLIHLLAQGRKDIESALFRYWLSRGPSASNVIGKEAIEALKQTARTIHYCMTPIFFLPRWRTAIALTRDSTSCLFKRARVPESDVSIIKQDKVRPRHPSDTSFRSVQSNIKEKHNLPIWSLWKRLHSERSKEEDVDGNMGTPKKSLDSWHISLCNSYVQEYMQYLQTLGFIPAQGNNSSSKKHHILTSDNWAQSYVGRLERVRRMSDGSVLSSESEKSFRSFSNENTLQSGIDKEENIYYLQKSLPGGIILLEVGFIEPFSYCKIHALEVHRIQGNKFAQRAANSHNTIAFVDECDKMKILMHLHSFAYDFHLRVIQNHICGKQVMKQGYHVTKFLDDFISYYCKGPSFARNTVNIGVLSLQNISTPSHILFDYILSHNKKYEMTVLRMNQLNSSKMLEMLDQHTGLDFALVYTLSKKVAYKEFEGDSHLGEFEMSLVITHDSQSSGRSFGTDPSVLRIKYYIVLTSRRELYPNLSGDLNRGKLFPVTAPEPLSDYVRQEQEIKRKSLDNSIGHQSFKESDIETRSCGNISEHEYLASENSTKNVIREEKVLYMGYFSSHEQMMQEILKEQTVWAETFIRNIVEAAAVDCRRDLLWQRLQVGGKQQVKTRAEKEKDELTLRETVGILTFWEFGELLELIHIQHLRDIDPKLKVLLNQPMNFFQTLIKLLANVKQYEHRYFVAPDSKVHQLVIINPHINRSVVLIEMNVTKQTNDLCILFKDAQDFSINELTQELDVEILNLIETAVGACCYCNWINCL